MEGMGELNVALTVVGALVLILGLFSGATRELPLSGPLIALVIGVIIGPHVTGLLDPANWGPQEIIIEHAARLTLAIGLMAVALRLPKADPVKRWHSLAVLLGLVMPLMWGISSLLVYLFLDVPVWAALLVGAVITPTDPVVATSIVTGELARTSIPARVRHTISAESGFNDGLAYPLVFLPIIALAPERESAFTHWFLHSVLWEVGLAVVFGVALGYAAGRLLRWAEQLKFIEETSLLAYTIALAIIALGGGALLGVDGILAVFLAGVAFDFAVGSEERSREERVQEAVNRFFTLPIFILLGLVLPWDDWQRLGWRGVLLVVAVLLFRRLPVVLAVYPLLRQLRSVPDALFVGWFGPVGVAALYYAIVAKREASVDEAWAFGSLMICSSIVAHGVTSAPFTKLYSRYAGKDESEK